MAEENDSSQEKSEEPTARRLEKAREEGQVARSKELGTTAVLIIGAGGLLIFGASIGKSITDMMASSFTISRDTMFDTNQMAILLGAKARDVVLSVSPLMILLFIGAVVGSVGVGGFLFSGKAITPQLNRLDPIAGIKRIFSLKSLMELVKAIGKVSIVLFVAILILQFKTAELLGIGAEPLVPAMEHAVKILGWSFLALSCTMIFITAIDVPFQIYEHTKQLKMTKQEVKDEFKDTEGKPEVKGKIRQLQMEMAQRRMMQDVPQADVVITNPTHYSVALKYDQDKMDAPVVLALGGDAMALKIREVATAYDVEIVAAPALARSIYYHSDIGQEIPSGLYMAVAQVLAYVFQLKQFRRRSAPRPSMPDFPIPDELRR